MILPIALALILTGCTSIPEASPQEQFFQRLTTLCGKAYEGSIASPPVEADVAFSGRKLVMHVRDCSANEIRIPFHVGDDRSRTWVVSRKATGLRLKHDHRHKDGSEDELTQYGGDTLAEGSASRQEFPADSFSKEMFERRNSPASMTNIWAMEVEPGALFAYELRRPGRFFRVNFDLERPVAPPPSPWGSN